MTIDAPTYRRSLAGSELNGVLAGLEGGVLSERRSLENETDPVLYSESLLSLAGRQERARHPELASRFYSELIQSRETPASQRERAQQRLAALRGEGELGARAEVLFNRFVEEATDPSALFAMTVAGTVFRAARFVSLARLAAHPTSSALSRGFGARLFSGAIAYSAEATAFPLAARLGNLALGRSQAWTPSALGRDLASSFMLLGALRVGGWASGSLVRPASFFRPLAQQAGMFGGIVLGHELEVRAGFRERSSGAITLLDSLVTLAQFNVAGRIQGSLAGESMGRWERNLEARSAVLEPRPTNPPPTGGFWPEPLAIGPAWNVRPRAAAPISDRVYMTQGGEGGGNRGPQENLIRAASLRVQITPPEAWSRRDASAREYLRLLETLPKGKKSTLDEIIQGVEMFGNWASSANSFQRAIGHRFYADAWRVLRDKFSHVDSHFALEEKIVRGALLHRQLISEGNNPRFLQQAVKASPFIAGVIQHQRIGLIEASPRDKSLTEALEQVLTTLRLGVEMLPQPSLRTEYLSAWRNSLYAVQAGRELVARHTVAAIRLQQAALLAGDPLRKNLAVEYYPEFWRLFREIVRVNDFHGVDFKMSEEIAFLQQNHNPRKTPHHVLEAVLKAYPFYVEAQIALNSHHLTQLSLVLDTFVSIGKSFRDGIVLTQDPSIREFFVNSYIDVLLACRLASLDLMPWQANRFPRDVPQEIPQEMSEGLLRLRERWTSEKGEFQIRALEQYWRLAREYPVQYGLDEQISSGPNLKPLSMLAGFNPDPKLRQAAEELLKNLLNRFSPDAPRH